MKIKASKRDKLEQNSSLGAVSKVSNDNSSIEAVDSIAGARFGEADASGP